VAEALCGSTPAKTRPLSAPAAARDAELKQQIAAVHAANYGVYGVRKMHAALRRDGLSVGRDQTGRLMCVSVENDGHFTRRSRWRELVYARAIALEYELDRPAARAATDIDVSDGAADSVVEPIRRSVTKHLAGHGARPHRDTGRVSPLWRLVAGGEGAAMDAAFTNRLVLIKVTSFRDCPTSTTRYRSSPTPFFSRVRAAPGHQVHPPEGGGGDQQRS
jgi:hypothetical protein